MDRRILESLEARLPWLLANRVLKTIGVEPSQGWKRTIDRLEKLENAVAEETLSTTLADHVLCGEKMTKFYRVSKEQAELLRTRICKLEPENGDFASVFPNVLNEEELKTATQEPELVSIVRNEDGVGAVYSMTVNLTVRETLRPQDLSNEGEFASKYDEIIGLRYRPVQVSSVVWVPHTHNIIEVRTDLPRGMPQELSHQIQSQFRNLANDISGQQVLVDPIDLFPLVNSMYGDEFEGRVVQLGFNTSTGSVKNEKMRRSQICLRKELYHVGGKNALKQPIEPFQVSIEWFWENDGMVFVPELTLAGTSRGRHGPGGTSGPIITAAIIKNCLGSVDYGHVQEKILEHLDRPHFQKIPA